MSTNVTYQHSIVRDGKGGSMYVPPFVTQAALDALATHFITRDSDVFLASYPKSGTTWMRQIVHLLANQGVQGEQNLAQSVPGLETYAGEGVEKLALLEAIPGRRYLMSHLPYALMPGAVAHTAKTIYVARNPKDCAVSFYYFALSVRQLAFDGDWSDWFTLFVEGKVPYGLVFDHVLDWWRNSQQATNILFVTYEDMQKDLIGVIAQVAQFVGIPASPTLLHSVAEQSTFQSMLSNPKANFQWSKPRPGYIKQDLRKGIVGDWRNHFTPEQNALFDALYQEKLAGTGLQFDFG